MNAIETSKKEKTDKVKSDHYLNLFEKSLQQGVKVDIVVNRTPEGFMDVRPSKLCKINSQSSLMLSQTDPPLTKEMIGKKIEVTFLFSLDKPSGPRWIRTGYTTVINSIINKPARKTNDNEEWISVPYPERLEQADLRMHLRITAPKGLHVQIASSSRQKMVNELVDRFTGGIRNSLMAPSKGDPSLLAEFQDSFNDLLNELHQGHQPLLAKPLDISMGGIRFVHTDEWEFPVASRLKICLVHTKKSVSIDGIVVRWGEYDTQGGDEARFTCLRFVDQNNSVACALEDMLKEIVRKKQGEWTKASSLWSKDSSMED